MFKRINSLSVPTSRRSDFLLVLTLSFLLITSLFAQMEWIQATASANWSARVGHTLVTSGDKIYVLGGCLGPHGFLNDVWYSTNGVDWVQATVAAGWSARIRHTSVVFDNKIWVLGGYGYDGLRKNDVWYSTDGVNWTMATSSAGWSGRRFHTSVVFDDKIWVLGGEDANGYKNDVWYSIDGVNWTQATASAGWSRRRVHTSVVFDDKIWVLGGEDANGYKNDVWYSRGIVGVEERNFLGRRIGMNHFSVIPNPFVGFATVQGFEQEQFRVYNIYGKEVGRCLGSRIGSDVEAGVYFLRRDYQSGKKQISPSDTPIRIVKVR